MRRAIDYFFYRIYSFYKKKDDIPLFTARLILLLVFFATGFGLLNLCLYFLKYEMINFPKVQIFLVCFILYIFIHLIYNEKRVSTFEEKFSKTKNKKRKGWFVVLVILFSFLINFLFIVIKHHL